VSAGTSQPGIPQSKGSLERLLEANGPNPSDSTEASEQALLWEISDWIVYQRAPNVYETESRSVFDLAAVTGVTSLVHKVVLDVGAGTGRVAFAVAPLACHVFAVEPVGALRRYTRDKAVKLDVENLFVLDGSLSAVPLPARIVDVLLTCHSIGWDLP